MVIHFGLMLLQKNGMLRVTSKILENNEALPNGYQFVKHHMIYDIKMKDF